MKKTIETNVFGLVVTYQ